MEHGNGLGMVWCRNNLHALRWTIQRGLRGVGYVMAASVLWAFSSVVAQSEPVSLRGAQYAGDLPTLIASTEGFFNVNGLEIEASFGHVGKANMAALRRGELDYALMAMTPFVLDRMRDPTPGEDGDPAILANLTHGASNLKIIARPEEGEPASLSAKSLEGKRIGLSQGTNAEYLWSLFADYHKLDRSKIDIADVPSEQIGDALAARQIDAAVIWAPWLQAIQSKFEFRLALFEKDIQFLYASRWILVTTKGTAPDRENRHKAVLRGYFDAIEWIQRHPNLAMKRFRTAWHIGDEQTAIPGVQDAIFDLTLDWSLYASYHQQLEWARRVGYPDRGGTGDFLTAVEPGPLRSLSPSSVLLPAP